MVHRRNSVTYYLHDFILLCFFFGVAFSRSVRMRSRRVVAGMGLHLGMEVSNWPPDNIEELAKKYEDQF